MSNEKKKAVTNINIKSLNRTARYEIDKKGPTPTLRKLKNKSTSSYNLVPAEKMPSLKMVLHKARNNKR